MPEEDLSLKGLLPDPLYNFQAGNEADQQHHDGRQKRYRPEDRVRAFGIVEQKTSKNPAEVFQEAMGNIMPALEIKARRVGGATYQVPIEVAPERRQTLGLRWIASYARSRSEKTMKERLPVRF